MICAANDENPNYFQMNMFDKLVHGHGYAERISWGSYLFQFWISGADFVQEETNLCHFAL